MSARNRLRKESNKAYRQAGAIYWTKDMEKIIRSIRRDRNIYGVASLVLLVVAILEALALFKVI